jgi:uncharacterized protein (DUF983 family)
MHVTSQEVVSRGLHWRCPNCQGPLQFARRMRPLERCPQCGLRWDRGNGFFLGAMVWNYGVTVFGLLLWVVLAALRGWIAPPLAIGLGLAIALIFPWIFYKWSWVLWLTTYYAVLPNELPVNSGAEHPWLRK